MGSLLSSYNQSPEFLDNRYPIYTPRHVPTNYPKPPNFAVFDKERYKDKMAFPAKEPPKYW